MTNYKDLKVFQKSQINGFTKYIAGLRFKNKSLEEILTISESFNMHHETTLDSSSDLLPPHFVHIMYFNKPKKITKEQSTFGKQWLKNLFFTQKGIQRKTKQILYVNDDIKQLSKSITRFEFIGIAIFQVYYRPSITHVAPIYRAYNKSKYFDYIPQHWGDTLFPFNEVKR